MVEMLGVLAIIAILSIGGIVGFRLAMNYYQANQIAHEVNLMRTDAQIKIAQGTEKLTLGSPYDSGNIQFNDYGTVFDCLDMETETSAPDKVVSCAVANAYYIELKEISEGVCKPLANLIDKMDNEVAFYINGKSVDVTEGEKGVCSEGLNTLKVIFGADSDSNAVKCDTDAECESLESTPFCDETRHICVQCTADDDCPYNTDYCEDNVCKTCENGVWNGENCVECTADGDCTDTPDTPKCNTETNTCVECLTYNDCTDTPATPQCNTDTNTCEPCPPKSVFYEGECYGYECRTNEDCADKGSGYYCHSDDGVRSTSNNSEWEDQPGQYLGGNCKNASQNKMTTPNEVPYVLSQEKMTWWSAQRFCEALNMTTVSRKDFGCEHIQVDDVNLRCQSEKLQSLDDCHFPVVSVWLELVTDSTEGFYGRALSLATHNNTIIDSDYPAWGETTANNALCKPK